MSRTINAVGYVKLFQRMRYPLFALHSSLFFSLFALRSFPLSEPRIGGIHRIYRTKFKTIRMVFHIRHCRTLVDISPSPTVTNSRKCCNYNLFIQLILKIPPNRGSDIKELHGKRPFSIVQPFQGVRRPLSALCL